MSQDYSAWKRQLGQASTAGAMLAICIAVGTTLGLLLDNWLGTAPWMLFIWLFLGISAGFYNLYKMLRLIQIKDKSS